MSKADKIVQIIIDKIEEGTDNKWQMPWHNRDFRFPINTIYGSKKIFAGFYLLYLKNKDE